MRYLSIFVFLGGAIFPLQAQTVTLTGTVSLVRGNAAGKSKIDNSLAVISLNPASGPANQRIRMITDARS